MIKLDYEAIKITEDEWKVETKGSMHGEPSHMVMEVVALLEDLESKVPDVFTTALDIFLQRRGL